MFVGSKPNFDVHLTPIMKELKALEYGIMMKQKDMSEKNISFLPHIRSLRQAGKSSNHKNKIKPRLRAQAINRLLTQSPWDWACLSLTFKQCPDPVKKWGLKHAQAHGDCVKSWFIAWTLSLSFMVHSKAK